MEALHHSPGDFKLSCIDKQEHIQQLNRDENGVVA